MYQWSVQRQPDSRTACVFIALANMFCMFSTSSDQRQFWYKHIWDSWSSVGGGSVGRGGSGSISLSSRSCGADKQPLSALRGTEMRWVKNINARQERASRWRHTARRQLSHIIKKKKSHRSPVSFLFLSNGLLLSSFFFLSKMTFYQPRGSQQRRHHPGPVLKVETEPRAWDDQGAPFVNPRCLPSLEAIKEDIFRMRQSEQISPLMCRSAGNTAATQEQRQLYFDLSGFCPWLIKHLSCAFLSVFLLTPPCKHFKKKKIGSDLRSGDVRLESSCTFGRKDNELTSESSELCCRTTTRSIETEKVKKKNLIWNIMSCIFKFREL